MRDNAFNSLAVCLNHESDGADFVPLRDRLALFSISEARTSNFRVELPQACHSE
jgi:hypothetical protein